jgi:hypothetical protein
VKGISEIIVRECYLLYLFLRLMTTLQLHEYQTCYTHEKASVPRFFQQPSRRKRL